MNLAAIAFWREMPTAVILLIAAMTCVVSARDIIVDDTKSVIEASVNERLRLVCGLKPRSQAQLVEWYKDGQPLDSFSKRVSQQKQWLRIKGFHAKDAGVYSCRNEEDKNKEMAVIIKPAQEKDNLDEYQQDVDVERPMPEILSQHQAAELVENNTIDDIKRFAKNMKFKEYDSKDEDPDDKYEKDHPNYGHVDNTKKKYPPKFKHPSKMFHTDMKPAGSSIRLKCAAEGNPTPNITWYKNRSTPIQRTYFQPGYGKWSMTLDELTIADNGNYTCVVCNELGCIEHNVALIIHERLYAKPVLTQGAVNITKVIGETARFSCKFLTDLHPYIFWLYYTKDEYIFNETVDPIDASIQETVYLDMNKIVSTEDPNDKAEQLTIFNVTKEDEGWYVCVALNSLGNTTAKGYLTVLELNNHTVSKTVTTQLEVINYKNITFNRKQMNTSKTQEHIRGFIQKAMPKKTNVPFIELNRTKSEFVNREIESLKSEIDTMKNSLHFITVQCETYSKTVMEMQKQVEQIKDENANMKHLLMQAAIQISQLEQYVVSNNLEIKYVSGARNLLDTVSQLGGVDKNNITEENLLNYTYITKVNNNTSMPMSTGFRFNFPSNLNKSNPSNLRMRHKKFRNFITDNK